MGIGVAPANDGNQLSEHDPSVPPSERESYKDFERAFPPPACAAKLTERCDVILARVRELFTPAVARRSVPAPEAAPPAAQKPPRPPGSLPVASSSSHPLPPAASQFIAARRALRTRPRSLEPSRLSRSAPEGRSSLPPLTESRTTAMEGGQDCHSQYRLDPTKGLGQRG